MTVTKKTRLLAKPTPMLTKVYPTNEPAKVGIVAHCKPLTLEGANLGRTTFVKVNYFDRDDMPQESNILAEECLHEANAIKINGPIWEDISQGFKPGSAVTFEVGGFTGTATISGTVEEE